MARPLELPIKKLVRFDEETLAAVDAYRATQKPLPNQSEAIRQILTEWLRDNGYLPK
jgi:hypothetical protein